MSLCRVITNGAKMVGINRGLFRITEFSQRIYPMKFSDKEDAKIYAKDICKDPDYLHISVSISDSNDKLLYIMVHSQKFQMNNYISIFRNIIVPVFGDSKFPLLVIVENLKKRYQ